MEKRLKSAKFDKKFIRACKETYEPERFKDVVELNVDLFLRKTDDHGVQVTDEAVERVIEFVSENKKSLEQAEREHGVPAMIIASLLWIESRYGKNVGQFHILSVFGHLLQAERKEVVKHLKGPGAKRFADNPPKASLAKIPSRAKKKAAWALSELKHMQKIFRKDPELIKGLRGSFAGAFGLPQFLPSSYAKWARSTDKSGAPDLNRVDDAVQSVAYFLHSNGWRTKRKKSYERALMNYNASQDYARAILKLAERSAVDQGAVVNRGSAAED